MVKSKNRVVGVDDYEPAKGTLLIIISMAPIYAKLLPFPRHGTNSLMSGTGSSNLLEILSIEIRALMHRGLIGLDVTDHCV